MFDFLTHLITGSPLSYLAMLGIVCVDSFFPLVPGETAVITAALLAANGRMSVVLVVAAALAGGVLGDNITYGVGRGLGTRARRRLFSSEKALHRLAWSEVQLERRGGPIILAARFIPGGRTATMFGAGSLGLPWRRFALADLGAAAAWALYATGLGYVGGETFRHSVWKPLAVAMMIALLVTAAGEAYRRLRLPDERRAVARRRRRFERELKSLQA